MRPTVIVIGVAAGLLATSGCVVVPRRAPIVPPPAAPAHAPRVEHTVGDFRFALGGAEPERSTLAGGILSDEIMAAWERRGFVRDPERVDADELSGSADYVLTLSGTQHNQTSFWAQLVNALTVMVVPYSVTQQYALHYELAEVHGDRRWRATVRDADRTWIGLLVIAGLPVMERGHREVVQRMSDKLYAEFRRQGAFEPSPAQGAAPSAPHPSVAKQAEYP